MPSRDTIRRFKDSRPAAARSRPLADPPWPAATPRATEKPVLADPRERPPTPAWSIRSPDQTPTVQRYQYVSSDDYQASFKASFLSQSLDVEGAKARYSQKKTKKPDLKVASDGSLAIEDTEDQPKVFFATSEVIEQSNLSLEDAGSAIRLAAGGKKRRIRVPDDPADPDAESLHPLSSVGWTPAGNRDALATLSVCSDVADRVAGGIDRTEARLVLEDYDDETSHGATKVSFNDVAGVALYETVHPEGSPEGLAKAKETHEEQVLDRNAYAAAFQEELDAGMMTEDALQLFTRLIAWTPRTLGWVKRKVRETYQAREPATPVTLDDLAALVAKEYGSQEKAQKSERSRRLGINEYAQPEVGEAYGTFPVGNRDYTGEHPAFLRQLQDLGADAIDALDGVAVQDGWTWHFAAVVAVSGDGRDRVTLENYNREVEKAKTKDKIIANLRQRFQEFDALVLRTERVAQGLPQNERVRYLRRKTIEDLPEASLELQVALDTAVASFDRLDAAPSGGQWYFKMYGPPDEVVDDEAEDQSFHREMVKTGDFANALTMRFRGDGIAKHFDREDQADALLNQASRHMTALLNALLGGVATKAHLVELYEAAKDVLDEALTQAGQARRIRRMDYLEAIEELEADLAILEKMVLKRLTWVF